MAAVAEPGGPGARAEVHGGQGLQGARGYKSATESVK
jgi:hypothetical protein